MTERDEITIDQTIEKCERIQEVITEINDAFADIIDIFRQAAADCESEDQPTEQGGR